MENKLGISRNLNLTTNEGLWKFYRGISKEELKLIYDGKYTVLDRFFSTNLDRAISYSFDPEIYVEIHYQVAFNWHEQMRIFNKLHKNKNDFFDIVCDRDLHFSLLSYGYSIERGSRNQKLIKNSIIYNENQIKFNEAIEKIEDILK
jgi:hypothetical protein